MGEWFSWVFESKHGVAIVWKPTFPPMAQGVAGLNDEARTTHYCAAPFWMILLLFIFPYSFFFIVNVPRSSNALNMEVEELNTRILTFIPKNHRPS